MSMQSSTVSVQVKIINRLGLHARPAMAFVDLASGYQCEVSVKKGTQEVDGKSIMQMMMLAATQGTDLVIEAAGADAQEAVDALKDLVARKFDED